MFIKPCIGIFITGLLIQFASEKVIVDEGSSAQVRLDLLTTQGLEVLPLINVNPRNNFFSRYTGTLENRGLNATSA